MGEQIGLFDAPGRRRREFAKRDEVLDAHKLHRAELLKAGGRAARRIWAARGRVTCPEMYAALEADPAVAPLLKGVDKRWTGAVFRSSGWVKVDWVPDGSHGRPVPVWEWRG